MGHPSVLWVAAWLSHRPEPLCLCQSVHISSWPGCEGRRGVGHSGANKLNLASSSLCTLPQPAGPQLVPIRRSLIPSFI